MGRPYNEDRPSKLERADRPKRVPIHGRRGVLDVKGMEEGWHYCWVNNIVNNSEGNLDAYQDAGYEFVSHACTVGDRKIDSASAIGGKISKAVGNGVTAFLMRCPQEVYEEELALMESEAEFPIEAMKQSLNSKEDGRYGQVTISQKQVV